ncbi:MAG: nicotinate (nicotinamide) nucleotide adenylyltransferase [Lachnospiraceae bacterium]
MANNNFHKIGIFGGTFNPIHLGHIAMAKAAYRQLDLEKVIFMPAKNPPHKTNQAIADEAARCEMCRLAIQDYKYFEYSDFEIKREGLSYSAVTLTLLQEIFTKKYGKDNFEIYFIIGADSFYDIEKWYKPEIVLANCNLTVAPRSDKRQEKLSLEAHRDYLYSRYNAKIFLLDAPLVNISSSAIRQSFKDKAPLKEFLNEGVYNYIAEAKLYE